MSNSEDNDSKNDISDGGEQSTANEISTETKSAESSNHKCLERKNKNSTKSHDNNAALFEDKSSEI